MIEAIENNKEIYNKVIVKGGKHLEMGSVKISGFKHVLAPLITASFLIEGDIQIANVPNIKEIEVFQDIFTLLSGKFIYEKENSTLIINTQNFTYHPLVAKDVEKIHGTIYLIPAMLGRFGKVEIGQTGGCPIGNKAEEGKRPVNHIIDVMEKFGSKFVEEKNMLIGYSEKATACTIDIKDYSDADDVITGPFVSGATKTAILAAIYAEGVTTIKNPYRKPDVTELITFLKKAGADIVDRDTVIYIEGRRRLRGTKYKMISDIIEIMTFITYAVYLKVPIKMWNITRKSVIQGLKSELECLQKMGVGLKWAKNMLTVFPSNFLIGHNIEVTSQSIFSDSHPFFTLMLLSANKPSTIKERVWNNRFKYAEQLKKLGADLKIGEDYVKIFPGKLTVSSQALVAEDVRAAAVLILASLGIDGTTVITGISHLNRGYENFIKKLIGLNCDITPSN